jgi:hypothetical protein
MSRSTESMMCGTATEEACVRALSKMVFVKEVFEVGIIALKEASWIAYSPDDIAIVDVAILGFPGYTGAEEALASCSTMGF